MTTYPTLTFNQRLETTPEIIDYNLDYFDIYDDWGIDDNE